MSTGLGPSGWPRWIGRDPRLRRITNLFSGNFSQILGDGLTIGADGKITADISEATFTSVKLRQTTNQSLPDATETAVAFSNGAEHDNSGGWFSAGANTKITVSEAGLYLLNFGSKLTLSGACTITLTVKKNGTTTVARMHVPSTTAGDTEITGPAGIQVLAASDFVELYLTQNTGGPQTIDEAVLAVTKLGVT